MIDVELDAGSVARIRLAFIRLPKARLVSHRQPVVPIAVPLHIRVAIESPVAS